MNNKKEKEQELIYTPCLSSAKRRFKLWIYEPHELIVIVGLLVFGNHIMPVKACLIIACVYTAVLGIYKHGKPDGFLEHGLKFHLRPKVYKRGPLQRPKIFKV